MMATVAFYQYMQEAQTKRFKWGENDCFCFAAGAVLANTGVDYMADLRGYGDQTSAEVLLQERFNTLSTREAYLAVARAAGARLVEPYAAMDGDVGCVVWPDFHRASNELDQSYGLGVYYRGRVVVCTPTGFGRVPLVTHRVIDLWRF